MATIRTNDWSNGYCPYLKLDANITSQTNDNATITYIVTYCTTQGGPAYTNGYGRPWSINIDGQVVSGAININGRTTFEVARGTLVVSKSQSARNIGLSISFTVDVNWAGVYGGTVSGSGAMNVPARTYIAHGNPIITANKTTANYGESITLSWAKSATQGNANFDRFELWQGSNKLYSGSGISKAVVPSDATGAQGGTATYTLKEIHEWYGTYPETSTTTSITVRSGVVSAYDSDGNKHTGLVTAYDSSGNSHFVLITAYDANGSPHSVV